MTQYADVATSDIDPDGARHYLCDFALIYKVRLLCLAGKYSRAQVIERSS